MLDLKQLKYFVVSADTGSFSEAAKVLYTTQSNVSKAVMALEKHIGVQLFYREARGITLTHMGRHIYEHAIELLDAAESLESHANVVEADWVNISVNPSSFFADRFAEFYNKYYYRNFHVRIQTGSTAEVESQLKSFKDEIGFVYVANSKEEDISYHFHRNHLEFTPICEMDMCLYLGERHPAFAKEKLSSEELENLRYIQLYQDDLAKDIPASIVTNSDDIMEAMLKNSPMANVSASGYSKHPKWKECGLPLGERGGRVVYGYLKRENEELPEAARLLVEYLMEKM